MKDLLSPVLVQPRGIVEGEEALEDIRAAIYLHILEFVSIAITRG
jgi:hypothetical protein